MTISLYLIVRGNMLAMKLLKLEPCVAPVWAKSGHAQTLFGHFLTSPALTSSRERVEIVLPDGDKLIGSFIKGTTKTTVTVFHGLTGSTDSGYMHRTARIAENMGHSVLIAVAAKEMGSRKSPTIQVALKMCLLQSRKQNSSARMTDISQSVFLSEQMRFFCFSRARGVTCCPMLRSQ
jgi:hypothetical protein